MTSNEAVTLLRNRLNKLNPELSFQDKDIWKEFTLARTRVLSNELSKRNKLSDMNYHTVCLELVDAPEHECACEPSVCTTRKTKYQLPSYLQRSTTSTLSVLTLKNTTITQTSSTCIEDDIKYKPGMGSKPIASVSNGFLYIHNSSVKTIQAKAIWSDPLELLFIQKCTTDDCLSDNKDLIQIDESKMLDIMNVAIQSLYPTLQLPEDKTGDNNASL